MGSFCPTTRLAPRAAGSESGVFLDSPSTRHRGNLEEGVEESDHNRDLSDHQTDQRLAETSGAEQVRDSIRSERTAQVSRFDAPKIRNATATASTTSGRDERDPLTIGVMFPTSRNAS